MQPRIPTRPQARFRGRVRAGARVAARIAALVPALVPALVAAPLAAPARAGDAPAAAPLWPEPDGTLILARPFGRSEISLRLSRRVAGAVDTLTWDGVTFLADTEPGDALQARAEIGSGAGCRRASEAGTPQDGTGAPAAHRLRALRAGRSWAETETRMAWDGPADPADEPPSDCPTAVASSPIQAPILRKRVALGLPGLGNAVEVQASFVLAEPAAALRLEPLAAAVPADFSAVWRFDPATGGIAPLDPGAGERPDPVILATPEGSHALAVWAPGPPEQEPDAPRPSFAVAPEAGANRLSCRFRLANAAAGAHDLACYALVGALADVRAALRSLTAPP
ncbi:hypothetical protein LOK46_26595 [Methylobacterium sp. NMS14P]|uniref:hypothetical protein n=1 Tax=Methylobacterium sp. NMS14P TaxID=2894310 RepID=UPI002358C77B|nr:hypothetical protein [Methylobacterium sp. NMS14P]WCS24656.1 hypothetical protein LOK46_26595 [Methylobacterium sp. NMS14P]